MMALMLSISQTTDLFSECAWEDHPENPSGYTLYLILLNILQGSYLLGLSLAFISN